MFVQILQYPYAKRLMKFLKIHLVVSVLVGFLLFLHAFFIPANSAYALSVGQGFLVFIMEPISAFFESFVSFFLCLSSLIYDISHLLHWSEGYYEGYKIADFVDNILPIIAITAFVVGWRSKNTQVTFFAFSLTSFLMFGCLVFLASQIQVWP